MELGHLNGLIRVCMWESFIITIFKGKECIRGVMGENMKENGNLIRCMEREHLDGLMGESIEVNIIMIRKRVRETFCGQMVGNILGDGKRESNMGLELTKKLMEWLSMENGKMERE